MHTYTNCILPYFVKKYSHKKNKKPSLYSDNDGFFRRIKTDYKVSYAT